MEGNIGTLLLSNVSFVLLITIGTSILKNVSVVPKALSLMKRMLNVSVTQLILSSTQILDNVCHAILLEFGTILTILANVQKAHLMITLLPRTVKLVLQVLLSGMDINVYSVLLVIITTMFATVVVPVQLEWLMIGVGILVWL